MWRLLLVAAAMTLAGCVSASTSTIPGMSFERRPQSHPIDVYATEVPTQMTGVRNVSEMPDGTTIGHVNVDGAEAASWNSVLERARVKARAIGGDALVIESWGHYPVTAYTKGGEMIMPVTSEAKELAARVVRFGEPESP